MLDAFCGTSCIALAASEFASVIALDAQHYARVLAQALLRRDGDYARRIEDAIDRIEPRGAADGFFSRTYAGNYFSAIQAAEIDHIRSLVKYDPVTGCDLTDALVLTGLFHAMSKAVASPGHFAQYLSIREDDPVRRESISGRAKSFLGALKKQELTASASADNFAAVGDAAAFLRSEPDVDVVFADPPYSNAHYSRFYHVLETVTLYDSPSVNGIGLYRPNRFQSEFCQKSKVRGAFRDLIDACASIGASVVVTYPSVTGHLNGLGWTVEDVMVLAEDRYSTVTLATVASNQSKLGTPGTVARVEGILVATNAR